MATCELPKGLTVGNFSPAPDGSHFLVSAVGAESQLLFVPVRADLKPEQITAVALK